MAPQFGGRNLQCGKRKVKQEWNSSCNTRLKEIAGLLPISVPAKGRVLSKKETLVHILQYLDFLQNHIQSLHRRLPPHCLPWTQEREWGVSERKENSQSECLLEPEIPFLKANFQCVWSCPQDRLPLCTEPWGDGPEKRWKHFGAEPRISNLLIEEEGEAIPMWRGCCDWSKPQHEVSQGAWPLQDSDSLTGSLDSALSVSQLFTCSAPPSDTDAYLGLHAPGVTCSDSLDRTFSDDSSPSSGMLHSPPRSSLSLLLRDHLDSSVAKDSSPRYSHVLPLQAVCETEEGLNLSPSLLTSPAHGLTHLLRQGQELQGLFEDVWVTPKSRSPKVPSLPCRSSTEKVAVQGSEWHDGVRNRDGQVSSESEGEDCEGEGLSQTPSRSAPPRRSRLTRQCRKAPRSSSSLKKKCVNGFFMFCRINRKIYLRTHPGTPSTLVTKELANLWHIMPKQDRCVYCVKARRFSRQQNRNVRSLGTEGEGEEGAASPLYMLLAHKDLFAATRVCPPSRNACTSHSCYTHASG